MFASLALHIVMMNEYELEIDKSIPINQMRMALARSMLGELYWRIGVFIDNNEMICCARIHFELAIEMMSKKSIPYKLLMFHHHNELKNNVCDFSIHTISIRDIWLYQHMLHYAHYLVSIQINNQPLASIISRLCDTIEQIQSNNKYKKSNSKQNKDKTKNKNKNDN